MTDSPISSYRRKVINDTGSNGSDAIPDLHPDWLEHVPHWSAAIAQWGEAWTLHLVFFSTLFLLQVILTMCLTIRFCRKIIPVRMFAYILAFVTASGIVRFAFLLVDPYGFQNNLSAVGNHLFVQSIYPGMCASYGMVQVIVVKVTGIGIGSKKLRSKMTIFSALVACLLCTLAVHGIVALNHRMKALLLLDSCVVVVWMMLLCTIFVCSGFKLSQYAWEAKQAREDYLHRQKRKTSALAEDSHNPCHYWRRRASELFCSRVRALVFKAEINDHSTRLSCSTNDQRVRTEPNSCQNNQIHVPVIESRTEDKEIPTSTEVLHSPRDGTQTRQTNSSTLQLRETRQEHLLQPILFSETTSVASQPDPSSVAKRPPQVKPSSQTQNQSVEAETSRQSQRNKTKTKRAKKSKRKPDLESEALYKQLEVSASTSDGVGTRLKWKARKADSSTPSSPQKSDSQVLVNRNAASSQLLRDEDDDELLVDCSVSSASPLCTYNYSESRRGGRDVCTDVTASSDSEQSMRGRADSHHHLTPAQDVVKHDPSADSPYGHNTNKPSRSVSLKANSHTGADSTYGHSAKKPSRSASVKASSHTRPCAPHGHNANKPSRSASLKASSHPSPDSAYRHNANKPPRSESLKASSHTRANSPYEHNAKKAPRHLSLKASSHTRKRKKLMRHKDTSLEQVQTNGDLKNTAQSCGREKPGLYSKFSSSKPEQRVQADNITVVSDLNCCEIKVQNKKKADMDRNERNACVQSTSSGQSTFCIEEVETSSFDEVPENNDSQTFFGWLKIAFGRSRNTFQILVPQNVSYQNASVAPNPRSLAEHAKSLPNSDTDQYVKIADLTHTTGKPSIYESKRRNPFNHEQSCEHIYHENRVTKFKHIRLSCCCTDREASECKTNQQQGPQKRSFPGLSQLLCCETQSPDPAASSEESDDSLSGDDGYMADNEHPRSPFLPHKPTPTINQLPLQLQVLQLIPELVPCPAEQQKATARIRQRLGLSEAQCVHERRTDMTHSETTFTLLPDDDVVDCVSERRRSTLQTVPSSSSILSNVFPSHQAENYNDTEFDCETLHRCINMNNSHQTSNIGLPKLQFSSSEDSLAEHSTRRHSHYSLEDIEALESLSLEHARTHAHTTTSGDLFRIRRAVMVGRVVQGMYVLTFVHMFLCLLELYKAFGRYGVLWNEQGGGSGGGGGVDGSHGKDEVESTSAWPWLTFQSLCR
ncbi:uncharacterized protein [Littorina saxatilis]|uniref:uncharacterized protein n=1 Tax=Littorina saxatilis TaxID=31220 RepID=UPI0038B63C4E